MPSATECRSTLLDSTRHLRSQQLPIPDIYIALDTPVFLRISGRASVGQYVYFQPRSSTGSTDEMYMLHLWDWNGNENQRGVVRALLRWIGIGVGIRVGINGAEGEDKRRGVKVRKVLLASK